MAKDTRRGLPRELYFDDDERSGRTGDPLNDNEAEALTPQRSRTAGLTGGDVMPVTVDNEPTADDLSPETLLREEGNEGSLDIRARAADQMLTEKPAWRIGAGHGKDEAELALDDDTAPDEDTDSRR